MIIHFICRANVLRSLIADTYLKSLDIPELTVISSGTEADHFRPTIKPYLDKTLDVLKQHGLEAYIKPSAEQLTQERIDDSDLIIFMSEKVHEDAKKLVTLPADRTLVWDIDDIEEGGRDADIAAGKLEEEIVFEEVVERVDELAEIFQEEAPNFAE